MSRLVGRLLSRTHKSMNGSIKRDLYMYHNMYFSGQPSDVQPWKMLDRKDGYKMSTYEMENLMKHLSEIMEGVINDPINYEPPHTIDVHERINIIRQLKFEYAPHQLRIAAAHFIIWYHEYFGKKAYNRLTEIKKMHSKTLTQQFNEFKRGIKEWSKYLSNDMLMIWNILNTINTEYLYNEMDMNDEIECIQMVRTLKVNTSMHMNDYKWLIKSYNDIMRECEQNYNFLDKNDSILCVTSSPFLGEFNGFVKLINIMCKDSNKESLRTPNGMIKSLQLPTGLDYQQMYDMIRDNDYNKDITKWENNNKVKQNEYTIIVPKYIKNNACSWYNISSFESNINDVDISGDKNLETTWNNLIEKYKRYEIYRKYGYIILYLIHI